MAATAADYYQTDVYFEQGGSALKSKSGGTVQFSGGKVLAGGYQDVTGTVAMDLSGTFSSIDYAWATMGTSPGTGAGNPFLATVLVSSTTLTLKVWQDDASAASDSTRIYYGVVGDPA